ncbi:TPA: hypothetical protein QCY53_000106 [Bacillus wiedmannii]|nr:hypothetical protein [Bacillus wiedmannii]
MKSEFQCFVCGNDGFFQASRTTDYRYSIKDEYGENSFENEEGEVNIYVEEALEIDFIHSRGKNIKFESSTYNPHVYVCDCCGYLMEFIKEKQVYSKVFEKNKEKTSREYHLERWESRKEFESKKW